MNLQLLNVSQHPVFDVWRARVLRYSSQAYCVCRILFEMNCSVHFSGEEVLIMLTLKSSVVLQICRQLTKLFRSFQLLLFLNFTIDLMLPFQ